MAARELIDKGESVSDASRAARREFGNVGLVKDTTQDVWGWRWLEDLYEDAHFGLRMLWKNPGFTAMAVLSLAIGIGGNAAMFSVVSAVLIPSLALPGLGATSPGRERWLLPPWRPCRAAEVEHDDGVRWLQPRH